MPHFNIGGGIGSRGAVEGPYDGRGNCLPLFGSGGRGGLFDGRRDLLLRQPVVERARQIRRSDLTDFDYVLAMDRSHLAHLERYAEDNHTEVALFLSYAKEVSFIKKLNRFVTIQEI